jgi:hypothetical protein
MTSCVHRTRGRLAIAGGCLAALLHWTSAVAQSTPTPTPALTPTCAPTGTPYCLDTCPQGCTEIRPYCLAFPCGPCFENPHCSGGEVCAPGGGFGFGGCCTCATVTPTPVPCDEELPAPQLVFEGTIEPPDPQVGDVVVFTYQVSNATPGLAGQPNYHLVGGFELFGGDFAAQTTGASSLGADTVTFVIRATRVGMVQMFLLVDYETAVGCVGDPVYVSAATDSPEAAVQVSSARCLGDCNLDGGVSIDELLQLVGLSLDGAVADPCFPGDADGDARIDIAELIRAVGVALDGCGGG